ncbi:MAG: hypothetical protein WCJ93_11115 [Methanomicrobiales archaeon]
MTDITLDDNAVNVNGILNVSDVCNNDAKFPVSIKGSLVVHDTPNQDPLRIVKIEGADILFEQKVPAIGSNVILMSVYNEIKSLQDRIEKLEKQAIHPIKNPPK